LVRFGSTLCLRCDGKIIKSLGLGLNVTELEFFSLSLEVAIVFVSKSGRSNIRFPEFSTDLIQKIAEKKLCG
jgi:hypothetical protein